MPWFEITLAYIVAGLVLMEFSRAGGYAVTPWGVIRIIIFWPIAVVVGTLIYFKDKP